MKIFYRLLPVLSVLSLTIFFSCNTTEPPPPNNGTLSISLTDVSCTEAWVNLKANGVAFPVNVNFSANGSTVAQLNNLNSRDTTVYIDSLLPNNTYNIQAIIPSTNKFQETSSNKLAVKTLDTTNNNFTWQTYTFGDPTISSCTLNDVAIIDENNIWAVGEFYERDSTGQADTDPYSIAQWDGTKWKLQKLYYITSDGSKSVIVNIRGILYRSSNDIWFSAGSIFHWNGQSDTTQLVYSRLDLPDPNATIEKLWGNSSMIYGVGFAGTIVYYNGSTWQKIESGTTTNLNDVWGYYDQTNNNLSVLTVASNVLQQGDYKLLAISDNTAKDTLNWPYTDWLTGVWFKDKYSPVFVSGGGVKEYHNGIWTAPNLNNITTECISGSDVNDVMAAGDFGVIFHFNGIRWKEIDDFLNQYKFLSVRYKGNIVALVGFNSNGGIVGQGIVVIGKH